MLAINQKNRVVHKGKKPQNKNSKKNSSYKSANKESALLNNYIYRALLLIPMILTVGLIPLIMKSKQYNTNFSQFSWYALPEENLDFFLYYKQWIFIGMAFIMLFILVIKFYLDKKSIRYSILFIPLGIYALLSLLSAVFSKYSSFSYTGSMDQFESIFALMGYCLVVFYAFQFIDTAKDIRLILRFLLISIFIMTALGLTQYLGKDFFTTEIGKKLITTRSYWSHLGDLTFNLEPNRIYLTLFNPNYVGVYTALLIPVIFTLLLFSKKAISVVFNLLALIGLIICVVGARSLTGIVALGVTVIFMLIFLWKPMLKKYYIFIPVVVIMVIAMFYVNKQTGGIMVARVKSITQITKTERNLTDIKTEKDKVSITYKGNVMNIAMNVTELIYFDVTDQNNAIIPLSYDEVTATYSVSDDRFPFTITPIKFNDTLGFGVQIDGTNWYFTNQTADGSYQYVNNFSKTDHMVTAPSAVFTGYETLASYRGYIWSRTIPLIRQYILLGSGPDTFAMAFPQQDYINLNYYFPGAVLTKPHCMYLQIAVQTGLFSLIALLIFYAMYFISSVRLYIKGRFSSYYSQVGVAIFLGSIAYMLCGLSNDSSITTAPVFWTLMGVGIAANYKAKPLILAENAEAKVKKKEAKELKEAMQSEAARN